MPGGDARIPRQADDDFTRVRVVAAGRALEADGGLCIISTHLGKGFVSDDRVEPRVERALREVAARDGWFVPVSTLLDHLRSLGYGRPISFLQRAQLEIRWMIDTFSRRSTRRKYTKTELRYLADSLRESATGG
jgi:hypothetical protein